MKRTAKLTTTLLLLAGLLASCGGTASTGGNTTASTGDTTTEAPETGLAASFTPELKTSLGLEDYVVNVFLRDPSDMWSNPDIYMESETGDVLDDAVYKRNLYLEETYGFTIEAGYSAETSGSGLDTLVLSGDETYDIAFPSARMAATYAQKGVLLDLYNLDYIDFDNSVWNKMFNDTLTFGGKLFFATGDITVNSYQSVRGFMFNKGLADKYKLDDPYTLVDSGKWTLDNFNKMCTAAAADLNGDSKMDITDQWGMAWQDWMSGLIFYYGAGEMMVDMDKNHLPVVSVGDERSLEVFEGVKKMMADTDTYYLGTDAEILEAFQSGRSLFFAEALIHAASMRTSDVEFGILPVPKYDEKQENYVNFADGWCISPVVVPNSVKSAERAGFIIEALAEASSQIVKPAYYDICLEGKYIRDEESSKMLDLIFGNFVLDNGDVYQWSGLMESIRAAFRSQASLTTIVASGKTALEKEIEKTIEAYEDIQ
ncbi:MAG: extracellular solute-binding protein [Ruminococcaceae bacterium]|nr:extracellular solute-binding protein [Oscillospiraceae bacterium]